MRGYTTLSRKRYKRIHGLNWGVGGLFWYSNPATLSFILDFVFDLDPLFLQIGWALLFSAIRKASEQTQIRGPMVEWPLGPAICFNNIYLDWKREKSLSV